MGKHHHHRLLRHRHSYVFLLVAAATEMDSIYILPNVSAIKPQKKKRKRETVGEPYHNDATWLLITPLLCTSTDFYRIELKGQK